MGDWLPSDIVKGISKEKSQDFVSAANNRSLRKNPEISPFTHWLNVSIIMPKEKYD